MFIVKTAENYHQISEIIPFNSNKDTLTSDEVRLFYHFQWQVRALTYHTVTPCRPLSVEFWRSLLIFLNFQRYVNKVCFLRAPCHLFSSLISSETKVHH